MTPAEFRESRKSLGLTQSALSQRLERTREMISKYENGKEPIPQVVALAMKGLATLT